MSCYPVAALILAAGAATRMGELKQLLRWGNKTLVELAIQAAMEAGFSPIVVVIGAESERMRGALAAKPVEIVENADWARGMGSSISAGMRRMQEMGAESAAVAILLADQPLVNATHLTAMRSSFFTKSTPVLAAHYNGVAGVPALFRREYFPMLATLSPEVGARNLLRSSGAAVMEFPLSEAAMDIDTPEDFAALALERR